MFPISIKGKLKVYSQDDEYFQQEMSTFLYNEFNNQESLEYISHENGFEIKGAPGRFTWKGFHILNGLSRLNLSFQKTKDYLKINFKMYFWETFLLALLFSIIPAFTSPKLVLHYNNYDYNVQQWLIFFIWIVLYFGNILVSFVRFKLLLNKQKNLILEAERDYIVDKKIKEVRELRQKVMG